MDEIIIKSDDLLVMNLINYFITEENYKPMIIHGINDEIWLENLDNNYKIVRIVSHHIHNKEQLDFDKFKLSKIVKQVKRKTLSFKVKVLSIYTDIEDEKILNNDDVLITKEKDINNPKLVSAFPDIVEKTNRKEDGLEYFIKVTVVFDAAVSGDGFDLKIGETEHLFGFGDTQGSQVVSHGDTKAFFKFT